MIPQPIFTHIMEAQEANHGASLVRAEKTYSLKLGYNHNDQKMVKATLFIHFDNSNWIEEDRFRLECLGFTLPITATPSLAWKDISLNQVPKSQEDEWKTWDEY